MKLRALLSFSGMITASKGKVFELENKTLAKDLIGAGYAELVAEDVKGGARGKGGNAPTLPPQTPPQVEEDEASDNDEASTDNKQEDEASDNAAASTDGEQTDEGDNAPATSTPENKSGAEKDK